MSDHIVSQVLKLERPKFNLHKLQLLGKGNSIYQNQDPLKKLDSEKTWVNSSLYLFHLDSRLRRACLRLVENSNNLDVIFRRRDELNEFKVGLINDDGEE